MEKRNYQKELDNLILLQRGYRPTVLLHSCCGPCSSSVLEYLTKYFRVTLLWYNPNLYPVTEFDKRLATQKELIERMNLSSTVDMLTETWKHEEFLAAIAEYEKEFGVDPLVPQATSAPINNEQIIKKVFDKLTSVPKIEVDVKWDDFPEAQINTLVEFLDVKFEDISAYIIKKYVNVEALALELTEILKEKLHKNIEDTIDE